MIARNELGNDRVNQLDSLIAVMEEPEVNYPNPYEMAIWADDIKLRDYYKLLDGWHFYDQPFYDGIDPKDTTAILDPNFNVLHTTIECLKTLKSRQGPYHMDGQFEKSLALRFFVHMAGDFHQPLHMTTRFTQKHKDGDAGGNKFEIKGTPYELHALWDQGMKKLSPDGGRVYKS